MRPALTLAEVLDEDAEVVAQVAAPWLGVLWLSALPLRLGQVHFAARILELGDTAAQYGDHLYGLALPTMAAFLLSLFGRAVFVRACGLGLRSLASPGVEALRLPAAGTAAYIYVALLVEALFFALGFTYVAVPLLVMLAGLAAATLPLNEKPGLIGPWREIARHSGHARILVGLVFVFGVALVVAYANLYLVFQLGLWLAQAIPGLDLLPWQGLLDPSNHRFHYLLLAGACLAVEPYWLGALTVSVHRLRSQQSGEDLRLRFERLRQTAAVLVLLGVAASVTAQDEEPLSRSAYATRLAQIESSLRGGALDAAHEQARALAASRVALGAKAVGTDATLLGPASRVRDRTEATRLAARIAALRAAVDEPALQEPAAADVARLERLRREQEPPAIGKGGVVGTLPLKPLTLPEQVAAALTSAADWLADLFGKLGDWLWRLWPQRRASEDAASSFELNLGVTALVATIAALLALMAYRALRRSQADPGEATSSEVGRSARDADPLSREANEWERYAAELTAAGRTREAIRAWYHAVLVTLFRTGMLHYRKERTNWEYASGIPPEALWRPAFLDITRAFDREWYGRDRSSVETLRACAAEARRILRAVRHAEAPA
jgi:hypothetical protein